MGGRLGAHAPRSGAHLGDRHRTRRDRRGRSSSGDHVFGLVTLPISLVWCGIAQLVGSQFRAPILSLLVTFGSFFVLWIGFVAGASGKVPPLLYLYPNVYDTWLLHPHPDRLFEGLGIVSSPLLPTLPGGPRSSRAGTYERRPSEVPRGGRRRQPLAAQRLRARPRTRRGRGARARRARRRRAPNRRRDSSR